MSKVCTKCGVEQPEENYYIDHRNGGPWASCKACHRTRIHDYRKNNPDKVHACDKESKRRRLDAVREWERAYRRDFNKGGSKYTEELGARKREQSMRAGRKSVRELSDSKVRSILHLTKAEATPELIEAKREQVLLVRAIKELKKEIKNARQAKDPG